MEFGPNHKDFKPFGVYKKIFLKNRMRVDFVET
jgi:hypothetical protein